MGERFEMLFVGIHPFVSFWSSCLVASVEIARRVCTEIPGVAQDGLDLLPT